MKKVLIFLFGILLMNCSNDSENLGDATKIDIVTGINLVGTSGQAVGVYGNPNTLKILQNSSKYLEAKPETEIGPSRITIYPTIANVAININAIKKIKNVWIVKATPVNSFRNFEFDKSLNNNLYSTTNIKTTAFKMLESINSNKLVLNASEYEKGYYRIFVQLEDDTIFWENIACKMSNNEANYW